MEGFMGSDSNRVSGSNSSALAPNYRAPQRMEVTQAENGWIVGYQSPVGSVFHVAKSINELGALIERIAKAIETQEFHI